MSLFLGLPQSLKENILALPNSMPKVDRLVVVAAPLIFAVFPFIITFCFGSYILLLSAGWVVSYGLTPIGAKTRVPIWRFMARLQQDAAAARWLLRAVALLPVIIRACLLAFLHSIPKRHFRLSKKSIRFRSGHMGVLDVYPSLAPTLAPTSPAVAQSQLAPIIVLVHGIHYGPLTCRKWMLAPFAYRLRKLGFCVIVPEVCLRARSDLEATIRELRMALGWVADNAQVYGGNAEKIYIMGHGLGAHLSLLLTIQAAAVRSRNEYKRLFPDTVLSNGLTEAREYGQDITIPEVEGLIMLAPICDTQKYIEYESRLGLAHLSPARNILGPPLTTCLFHSPAHLLFAARTVINTKYLPAKFLFIHGGQDESVPHAHSDIMYELLVGVGAEHVQKQLYRWMGHTQLIRSLYSGKGLSSITGDVTTLIPIEGS